jgi:hypothetical protein
MDRRYLLKGFPLLMIIVVVLSGCIGGEEKKPVKLISEPKILILQTEEGWIVNVLMSLPTPCHRVEYVGKQVRGNEYYLDFSYSPPSQKVCAQVVTNFNQSINLGKLDKGDYKVILRINGQIMKKAEFRV